MFPLSLRLCFLFTCGLGLIRAQTPTAATTTTTNTTKNDFADFNQIFQDAKLLLPDADISTNGLDLNIRELICSQVIIDNMTVISPSSTVNTTMQLQVDVTFSLTCQANYAYFFPPFFRGDGRVAAMTRSNQFTTHLTFLHNSSETVVTVDICQAQVQIYDLDFRGGLVARLVEVAEGPVANLLQTEIQDALCEQLTTNGGVALEQILNTFLQRVDPSAPVLLAPNLAEAQVLSSRNGLFDFLKYDWFARGLEQVQQFLGASEGDSLGINSLLRNRLLNNQGLLVVNLKDVMKNTTILSSHGRLTKSSIILQNLEIQGLDSLTQFDALQVVSNYTVRNTLRWKALQVRIQARILMQASSQNNSLFVVEEGASPRMVEEDIVIEAGLNDLVMNLNLLFATDESFWKNMPLANLLGTSTVYNCFLQSIRVWNVTQFTATAGSIVRPTLTGFVDEGLDRIASSTVDAFLNLLEPTFQAALPNLAHTLLRDWINTDLLPNLRQDVPACPTSVTWPTPVVDFRDLLLAPAQSQALGGSGSQPYGDLVQYAYDAVTKKFDQDDELNDFLIRPFTSSQSGVAGTLALFQEKGSLVVVDHSLLDLSLNDLKIQNLDTIQHNPIQVLNPTKEPTVLANEIQLGNGTMPNVSSDASSLTFAFQTQFRLGDWVPQQQVGFLITMPKVKVDTSLNLAMNSTFVSNFPLGHVSKLGCWMQSIVNEKKGLIQALSLDMAPWQWQAQCVNCSSGILSSVLEKMQTSRILSDQWPALVTDLLKSNWIEEWLQFKVDSATCSLVPKISTAVKPTGIPVLSNDSLDTALFTGIVSLWTTFLVIMEQHEKQELTNHPTNFSGADDDTNLIDFTNLGNSTGLGSLADEALQQGRVYLLSKDESTEELKINALMRDWFLSSEDESGDYALRVSNMEQVVFQQENGLLMRIDSLVVRGLDTFTQLDLLKPVDPQIITSALQMRNLSMHVQATVGYSNGPQQNLTISLELEDLELELDLFVNFPVDSLEKIPLRSVLQLKNLLPCVLSTAKSVEVPRFNAKIGTLSSVRVKGLREGTDQALLDLIDETLRKYEDTILKGIPKLASSTLRTLLSNKLSDFISSSICPPSTASSTNTPFVDLRELLLTPEVSKEYGGAGDAPYGNIFPSIAEYIEDEILATDPKSGVLMLNKLIGSFTKSRSGTSGSLVWSGDLMSTNTNVDAGGLNARVRLRVYDAFIHHLDSFSGDGIQILEPVRSEPHQTNNTASIGRRQPVEMGAGIAVEFFSPGGTNIKNDVKLSLSADDVQFLFRMLMKIVESSFLDLPLAAIGNLDCWLATLENPKLNSFGVSQSSTALELLELSLRVARLRMNATCVSCSGPKMEEFTKILSETRAVEDMTRVGNRVLGYLKDVLGGSYLQVTLDRMIAEGHRKCPYGTDYGQPPPVFQSLPEPDTSEPVTLLVALFLSCFALITGILVVLFCRRMIVRIRHRKWVQSLAEEQLYHVWSIQTEQDKFVEEVNSLSSSLYLSKEIPRLVRFFIPVSIVGNIALFLSGHLSLGGSVTIVLQLAGESYTADNFFEFSMAKSAIEIWNGKSRRTGRLSLLLRHAYHLTAFLVSLSWWERACYSDLDFFRHLALHKMCCYTVPMVCTTSNVQSGSTGEYIAMARLLGEVEFH
jgi:hypothetical protein